MFDVLQFVANVRGSRLSSAAAVKKSVLEEERNETRVSGWGGKRSDSNGTNNSNNN
jgi:hypothetical protein